MRLKFKEDFNGSLKKCKKAIDKSIIIHYNINVVLKCIDEDRGYS